MMRTLTLLFFLSQVFYLSTQSLEDQINHLELEIEQLEQKKLLLNNQMEDLRCEKILSDLDMVGLPSNDGYISHRAMVLAYSEA
jgi:cell division protein FtsB